MLLHALYAETTIVDNNTTQSIDDRKCFDKTFTVVASGYVTSVRFDIDITHTWRADLDISLSAPDGTQIDLTTDNGGSSDNLFVRFRDDAATSIVDDSQSHTVTVDRKPEEQLSTFNALATAGDWTLTVCDDARGDTGTYNGGRLTIDYLSSIEEVLQLGLQVNFRMDECYWLGGANGVDDDVKDSSANLLHAQSRNKADITSGLSQICRAGDFNNTYSDPNLSDAVFYPNQTVDEKEIGRNAPFTVSAWLYRRNNDKWMAGVIRVSDESWEDGWGLVHTDGSGNNIDFFVNSYQTFARTSLSTDTWTHIVATYDGTTIKLYKNGSLAATQSQETYTVADSAIVIGDDVSGASIDDRWQGSIDEVKVWNRVLSDNEIQTIYNNESAGKNFDGSIRECKQCNGSTINANSWDLISIPVDLRSGTITVADVFSDDMNGSYNNDWYLVKRVYSSTDNSSSYEYLSETDTLEFGAAYWLASRYSNEWYVDGLPNVDYNSTHTACVNPPCIEIDLTSVTHDFNVDGDDGTGPYRYNMSSFPGLIKPVDWADCRFLIDGTAYTPSDANQSGFASKQIWLYNGTGTDASNSYTTCDDTMECKLIPFKGFWIQLQGKTKNKTVKLLIPKE